MYKAEVGSSKPREASVHARKGVSKRDRNGPSQEGLPLGRVVPHRYFQKVLIKPKPCEGQSAPGSKAPPECATGPVCIHSFSPASCAIFELQVLL